jgi:hypothetical protein
MNPSCAAEGQPDANLGRSVGSILGKTKARRAFEAQEQCCLVPRFWLGERQNQSERKTNGTHFISANR